MISLTYQSNPSFYPPQVQSHRGRWNQNIGENSLTAIIKSFDSGFTMTEFDVRLTSDGVVVLFHDSHLNQRPVHRFTYEQLKKDKDIDTLESVLQWLVTLPNGTFYLNIEIKSKSIFNRRLESAVLALIQKYKVEKSILISSFNPLTLSYFKTWCPQIVRSLLLTYRNENGNNFLVKSQVLNVFARPHCLHLDENDWNMKKFAMYLEKRIPIILWTCNDLERARHFIAEGVHGVISDVITPEDLRQI